MSPTKYILIHYFITIQTKVTGSNVKTLVIIHLTSVIILKLISLAAEKRPIR